MARSITATVKMYLMDFEKIVLIIGLMGIVFIVLLSDNSDPQYKSMFFNMITIAGTSAVFFTSAGVYQKISLGFGCTRRDYFIAVQAVKLILSIVVYAVITLISRLFLVAEDITVISVFSGIVGNFAIFSGAELLGYLTLKIGRWGLMLMSGFAAVAGGTIAGLSVANPLLLSNLTMESTLIMAIELCLAILLTVFSYLFCRKYSVRGQ